MTDTNPKLQLIQSLLDKAADKAVGDAEREAYMAKAEELMAKYSIDALMLASANRDAGKAAEAIVTKYLRMDVPKMYAYEFASLGVRVAEVMGGRGLFSMYDGRRIPYIIAYQSDMDLIIAMVNSLARQCTFALASWSKSPQAKMYQPGSHLFNAKRGFINAFVKVVAERIKVTRLHIVEEAHVGTDLVLARDSALDAAMAEERTGNLRGRRYYGSAAGREAGQRADIGQQTINYGRQAIGQ